MLLRCSLKPTLTEFSCDYCVMRSRVKEHNSNDKWWLMTTISVVAFSRIGKISFPTFG